MTNVWGKTPFRYQGGGIRVGCWNCDYVMAAELGRELTEKAGEEHLHRSPCPHCGERELHAFGEFGCWPSEVGDPPCRR